MGDPNNETETVDTTTVDSNRFCDKSEDTVELIVYTAIGVGSFIIFCEIILFVLICRHRRRLASNISPFDTIDSAGGRNFRLFSVSYVHQMRKEGCLKCPEGKYTNQDARLALEDRDYHTKGEMVKSNICWYFDLNTYESPYFGFTPAKKDNFFAAEKVKLHLPYCHLYFCLL